MGKLPWRQHYGSWHYPPLEDAMRMAGLEELDTYIVIIHNMVDQYINTRLFLDLCL